MFPPQVPHVFIRWLTEPGDVVYDPFSGRGTAPFEACRMGRLGLGSDANPLAYLLTAAKVDPPSEQEARTRMSELRNAYSGGAGHSAPANIRMLYSPRVLDQLVWLRDHLDLQRRDDRLIMGLLMGVMHANYTPGRPARGLSISMPNTFSMSPDYVRRYIDEHGLEPPDIDVFDLMEAKLKRIKLPDATATRGLAWQQDAREPIAQPMPDRPVKLVFTSPPYLSVIKYGKYNWVRLWMLKQDPKEVDDGLVTTGSLTKYLVFMSLVLENLGSAVRDDGYVCVMIGDVRAPGSGETLNLAARVWEEAARHLGWTLRGIVEDRLPTKHKVSRIWKNGRGRATKTDRVLILSRDGSGSDLPPLGPIRWSAATAWA